MEERKGKPQQMPGIHKLSLNNRNSAILTGICDVISFDLKEVLLETQQGMLHIKGEDLHVNRINVEKGEVDIEGRVDSLTYSEVTNFAKKSESLLSRLFR